MGKKYQTISIFLWITELLNHERQCSYLELPLTSTLPLDHTLSIANVISKCNGLLRTLAQATTILTNLT